MKTFLVLCMMATSFASQAQYRNESRVTIEAERVAREIRYSESRLSRSQEDSIMEHLRAISRVLQGNGNGHGGGYHGSERASYTCVARDNDDRAPWVIAIREGLNVARIRTVSWNTKSACENVLGTTVAVRGKNLFCVARDNDDRAPFVLATLNGENITKFNQLSWNTTSECQSIIREVRPYKSGAIFCTARDNDGRSPFVALELNIDDFSIQKGTESFNTIGKCNEFLGR